MEPLYCVEIDSYTGKKEIAVYLADATCFDEPIDILTVSAYYNNYYPTPRTLIQALLSNCGISVMDLAENPEIDLRKLCHVWLSHSFMNGFKSVKRQHEIGRIGCVELVSYADRNHGGRENESGIIKGIKSYFQMLDLAATHGIEMHTVAFPFLGAGSQNVNQEMVKYPLINECISSLKRNAAIKKIIFIEKSPQKAFSLASTLEKSYSVKSEAEERKVFRQSMNEEEDRKKVFISYSTKDKRAADILCDKLETAGVDVWYAPRDILKDDYATAIVNAIRNATGFITMISKNSMHSEHVLNEIDVAFNCLAKNRSLIPVRLDKETLVPAFEYYLSRFQWTELFEPYSEEGIKELIERIRMK